MRISKMTLSNFKSFDRVTVDLDNFNVLIGANAAGKSNFISAFKFLKDIADTSLQDAISMQGGVEYIRNIRLGTDRELSVELEFDCSDDPIEFGLRRSPDDPMMRTSISGLSYSFSLEFYKTKSDYRGIQENLLARCSFWQGTDEAEEPESSDAKNTASGQIEFSRNGKELSWSCQVDEKTLDDRWQDLLGEESSKEQVATRSWWRKELFMLSPFGLLGRFGVPPIHFWLMRSVTDLALYDFRPKLSKMPCLITGRTELEPDASNLAIVLKKIRKDPAEWRRLNELLNHVLPFVEDVRVQTLADRSLFMSVREVHQAKPLPATFASDGTLNVAALVIALYFDDRSLVLIEEPERNIHPSLISEVVDMMKDASQHGKKQIIATTHNPEVVRHAGVENILLAQRDAGGFSKISRPQKRREVRIFLENEMGLDELYVENLLEW